jgi:hypothetical protein
MAVAMVWRRPEELTALPRARPPAARMMMVHRKLLKSSLVRMPVPKNRTIGMIATHVAEDAFKLMTDAPEYDGDEGDDGDEPLDSSKAVLHRPDGHDRGVAARAESDEEKNPDQNNRDDADWECDEEPDTPAWCRVHVLESDQVLGRSDRRGSTANVAGKGNSKKKSLGHVRVGGQVAKNRLICVSKMSIHTR